MKHPIFSAPKVGGLMLLGLLLLPVIHPSEASAVTASDWQAGNIIDDSIFTDDSAMTVSQIQAWLDARLKNCDPNGLQTSELSGGTDYNGDGRITRAEYGQSRGNPAPFTCLNKYYEVPKTTPSSTIPASNYGKSTIPSGAKSAAQLIYDAGRAYNISPKVLLVKLGTESAGPLTSDTWPFKSQYTYAMGAHCPDSGPGGSANCDVNYSGFSLQMREAAKLLRWYLDNMDQSWWPYKKPYTSNNILWNVVERGCGGSNVYIKTKATAALYTYTPYQPNAAALANMYGTGDNCSAYGNRNFWRVYNDWFGSTNGTPLFRIDGKPTVYMLGENNIYYRVDSMQKLIDFGWGVKVKTIADYTAPYLYGKTYAGTLSNLVRLEGSTLYAVERGLLHPFDSPATMNAYGYSFGQESSLLGSMRSYLTVASTMRSIAVNEYGSRFYINAGTKRYITTDLAYKSGSPRFSSLPGTGLGGDYLRTITNGSPIWEPGLLVKASDSPTVYLVQGPNSVAQIHNVETFSDYGFKFRNVITISRNQLAGYNLEDANLSPFVKSSNGAVYMVGSNGLKHLVDPTLLGDTYYNIDPATLLTLNAITIDKLTASSPATNLIRPIDGNTVYEVTNGTLVRITSAEQLFSMGYDFTDVIGVPAQVRTYFTAS